MAKQLRLSIFVPYNPKRVFKSSDFRKQISSELNNNAPDWFFGRRSDKDKSGCNEDFYPSIIFDVIIPNKNKNDTRQELVCSITATGGRAITALESYAERIVGKVSDYMNTPCHFKWTVDYVEIKLSDQLITYKVFRPVLQRKIKNVNEAYRGDSGRKLLIKSFKRTIDRLARSFVPNAPDADDILIDADVTNPNVTCVKYGKNKFYFCAHSGVIKTNLDIRGRIFVGGMASHGHGCLRRV